MSVSSITSQHSTIFSLDKILQDIPETAIEELSDIEETYQSYKEELNIELKTTDRVWLEFHAGQCEQYGKAAQSILYRIVKSSVSHPENSIAAANAITILKTMKVSFSCLDLKGIQIPGADLADAILDRANISDANLENVNLINASLNGSNILKTNLRTVKFGISDTLTHDFFVRSSIVSPDNKYLVSKDDEYVYCWNLLSKICVKKIAKADSDSDSDLFDAYNSNMLFSPDGQFLLIYDDGNKYINIWSVGDFKRIKRLKAFDSQTEVPVSLSLNGKYLITSSIDRDLSRISNSNLKVWEIQKTENNLLDFNLKNEIALCDIIYSACFSKKFPVFYCFKRDFKNKTIYLSICNVDNLLKVANIIKSEWSNFFVDIFITSKEEGRYRYNNSFSLVILDTGKSNEELLFIAVNNFIYSVHILRKKEHNWPLESTQITKLTHEVDAVFDMQILAKTHELIYLCNGAVCLYSIKDNLLIGKSRQVDRAFSKLSVSFDGANIYISNSSKVFIYSVEALKNSKHIPYQMDNKAACFSSDMHSIISISSSSYITLYDIETGNVLRAEACQKIKSLVSDEKEYEISFSLNAQYILIRPNDDRHFLHIIDTENEKTFLEMPMFIMSYVLSNNSEYLAFNDNKNTLEIYKTIPYKQCIGKFRIMHRLHTEVMAISKDFLNIPKVVLKTAFKMTILNFVFKDEILALVSEKELPQKPNIGILLLQFIKNDSKLLVVYYNQIVILDIEHDQHEGYNIPERCKCAAISHDETLLIYYDNNNDRLCLWSINQKKPLKVQVVSLPITVLQISLDNKYIIGTTESGSMYVWKIAGDMFRLLWRTSHNLQTQGLILSDNNLEKDVEEDLIAKMGAIKIDNT